MARLFTDVLGEIDRGCLAEEATDKLAELIRDIREHGKPGTGIPVLLGCMA